MTKRSKSRMTDDTPMSLLVRAGRELVRAVKDGIGRRLPRRAQAEPWRPPAPKSAEQLLELSRSMKPPTAAMMFKYVRDGSTPFGPVTGDELRRAILSREVGVDTLVSVDGGEDWNPAWIIPDLCPRPVTQSKVESLRAAILGAFDGRLADHRVRFENSPLTSLQEFAGRFETNFVRDWVIAAGGSEFVRGPHGFRVRIESEDDGRASGSITFWGPILRMGESPTRHDLFFISGDGIWTATRAEAEFDHPRAMFRNQADMIAAANRSARTAQAILLTRPEV